MVPRGCQLSALLPPLTAALLLACPIAMAQPPSPADVPRPLTLRARIFTPPAGVDPALLARAGQVRAAGGNTITAVAQWLRPPDPAHWARWQEQGLINLSYLGGTNWILRLPLAADVKASLTESLHTLGAVALTTLAPEDKAAPSLAQRPAECWAYDEARDLLRVVVGFYPRVSPAFIEGFATAFHAGSAKPQILDPQLWAIEIRPQNLPRLLAADEVSSIEPGPVPQLPLLNSARGLTGVDEVQMLDLAGATPYLGLTGKGVRLSTGEGFDAAHDDFWNHDGAGARTTPRWLGCSAGSAHGTMTAGIALGNGFRSAAQGGGTYQYRGVAPEATFDCPTSPDVSNHSFVQTFGDYTSVAASIDSQVRGDSGNASFHPQVWAVANQGITAQYGTEVGYYSAYAPAKNAIVVANLSSKTLRWMQSSLGPTWDGRLKPDLGAPGTGESFPEDRTQILLDLDRVRLASSTSSFDWTFDATTANWHGGWRQHPWWGGFNIGPATQIPSEGAGRALRVPLLAPPWPHGLSHVPMVGTLRNPANTLDLNFKGSASDVIEIRYRVEPTPSWAKARGEVGWMLLDGCPAACKLNYDASTVDFPLIPDGQWHTASVPVGKDPKWTGAKPIGYLYVQTGGSGMFSAGGKNGYVKAGGSSAAAPFVTGAVALLLQGVVKHFGVQLGSHAPSPFWMPGPGTGVPLPSTLKALLIHGARDLASLPHADEPLNPDTLAPTRYHAGPDLVTGYGALDVAASARLLSAEALAPGLQYIVERPAPAWSQPDSYTVQVPTGSVLPLKVTLAWDDAPANPLWDPTASKLVNDLDLEVIAPDGTPRYPYTLDPPYVPAGPAQYPGAIEPEPISAAAIRPARQDQANHKDNVEQVFVSTPVPGAWTVRVRSYQLYMPPQKYSLILGTPPPTATHLEGGKVVFVSDRVSPRQLFVKEVDAASPPVQLTSGSFAARAPAWSPDGRYVAYLTKDVIVSPQGSTQVDAVQIVEVATKKVVANLPGPSLFGVANLAAPAWSPDGRRLALAYWHGFGDRALGMVELGPAPAFPLQSKCTLLPFGVGAADLDPGEVTFSHDGARLILNASSNAGVGQLFQVEVPATCDSATPFASATPMFGDGGPIHWAFEPSVSPDGRRLLFNSELWRVNPVQYRDEELLELDLLTGVVVQRTYEAGQQYGSFAIHGAGEAVMRSNASAASGSPYQLFLIENGVRKELDVNDPNNQWSDDTPDWWKEPCTKAPSDLAAWWPLDETSGSTAADLSGHNQTGAHLGGPTPTAGSVLGGLGFDGVNDYVHVPSSPALNFGTGDWSFAAWVRQAPGGSGIRVLLEKRSLSPLLGYSVFSGGTSLGVQLAAPNGFSNYIASAPALADGLWHHVAVTVDRDQANGGRFFLDGEPLAPPFNPTARAGSLTNTSPLRLGVRTISLDGFFSGALDEVQLFSRALSPLEIRKLYQAGSFGVCKP